MKKEIIIKGERIYLRTLTQKDATEEYIGWLNNKTVNKFLDAGNQKHTIKSAKKYIKAKQNGETSMFFGIFDKNNNTQIGTMKIEPLDIKLNKQGMIGILIGNQNYWGKGYATESMNLLVKWCFDKLKLNKVTLGVAVENKPAVRVYEKCGFKIEGTLREDFIKKGKKYDSYRMAILRSEYKQQNVQK